MENGGATGAMTGAATCAVAGATAGASTGATVEYISLTHGSKIVFKSLNWYRQ